MTFAFGTRSEEQLSGVDSRLVRCARRAIALATQDFTVWDGIRVRSEQEELVKAGASMKHDSAHLYGRAIDLVPWIAGRPRWQAEPANQVAIAMREAALHFKEPVIWGGLWRPIREIDPANIEDQVQEYRVQFRERNGRYPFVDRFHFEVEP